MVYSNGHKLGRGRGRLAGIGIVFLWFFIGAIMHFVAADTGHERPRKLNRLSHSQCVFLDKLHDGAAGQCQLAVA